MSGRGKRLWAPRLGFDEAYREVLDFLKNCHKHNLTAATSGTMAALYHVYKVDSTWPVEGLIDASSVLRFGFDRNPTGDQAKQAMARLLSVVTKAHFFLTPEAIVVHEPYLFVMPDLGQPGLRRYGLVYPLEHQGRLSTLVVAEWDLAMSASRQIKLPAGQRFPVVLPADPFQWLALKHWRSLKEEAGQLPWFDTGTGGARAKLMEQVRLHTDLSTFSFGHPLMYPKELNDDMRAVGALWSPGIRRWFLPRGWDIKAVTEYLDRLLALSPSERYGWRWWTSRPYTKANGTPERED